MRIIEIINNNLKQIIISKITEKTIENNLNFIKNFRLNFSSNIFVYKNELIHN